MIDLHRVARRRIKRSLRSVDELAFSPVHVAGEACSRPQSGISTGATG